MSFSRMKVKLKKYFFSDTLKAYFLNEVNMDRSAAHEKLVDALLVALSKAGDCRVWRQPTGAAYRDGKLVRYGVLGSADISGIMRNGKRLEIEVKTGRGVQTERQKAFQSVIANFGGLYLVARDVESVVNLVKSAANV